MQRGISLGLGLGIRMPVEMDPDVVNIFSSSCVDIFS